MARSYTTRAGGRNREIVTPAPVTAAFLFLETRFRSAAGGATAYDAASAEVVFDDLFRTGRKLKIEPVIAQFDAIASYGGDTAQKDPLCQCIRQSGHDMRVNEKLHTCLVGNSGGLHRGCVTIGNVMHHLGAAVACMIQPLLPQPRHMVRESLMDQHTGAPGERRDISSFFVSPLKTTERPL